MLSWISSSTNMKERNLHLSKLNVLISAALELGAYRRRLCRRQPCLYGFICDVGTDLTSDHTVLGDGR